MLLTHETAYKPTVPKHMMNILISIVTGLTVTLSVGAVWMAIWAWRTFQISIFAWFVAGRIVVAATSLLTTTPDHAKLESAIKTLQAQSNLNPSDLLVSVAYFTSLFPILSLLGFVLIALGEISHFGPRITPTYEPHWILNLVYRLRHLFGVFAATCTLIPTTALYVWFHSMS